MLIIFVNCKPTIRTMSFLLKLYSSYTDFGLMSFFHHTKAVIENSIIIQSKKKGPIWYHPGCQQIKQLFSQTDVGSWNTKRKRKFLCIVQNDTNNSSFLIWRSSICAWEFLDLNRDITAFFGLFIQKQNICFWLHVSIYLTF